MAAPSVSGAVLFGGVPSTAAMIAPVLDSPSSTTTPVGLWGINNNGGLGTFGSRIVVPPTDLTGKLLVGFNVGFDFLRLVDVTDATTPSVGMVSLFDGTGNYVRWIIFGGNLNSVENPVNSGAPTTPWVIDPSYTATAQSSAGILNLTDIVAIELHLVKSQTQNATIRFSRFYLIDELSILGGEVGNPARFANLVDYAASTTDLAFSRILDVNTVQLACPLRVGADLFESANPAILFYPPANFSATPPDPRGHFAPGRLELTVAPAAGGSSLIEGGQIKSPVAITFKTELAASATNLITGTSLNNYLLNRLAAPITINGLNITYTGTTTDLSNSARLSIPNEVTFNFNTAAGTYDFSGLENASGSFEFDNLTANNITVLVNAELVYTVASPTTGGGTITIDEPVSEIAFLGLPNVANVRLLVRNLTADTQEFYTVTGGTISIPTNPTSTYEVRADAPGYLASDFVELPGNTPQFRFNLINRRDIYDAGVTRFDRIILDPITFAISITDGPALTPEDVFRTLEDYLVIEDDGEVAGLLYTAHPIPVTIPGRFILRFVYDLVNDALNPARLKPHPDNVGDPELLFEIELERAEEFDLDPTYALLDYSDAPVGRIIRVRSQVAIANVNVSGGLSTEDRGVIDGIAAKVAPLTYTVANQVDANALSGGGGASAGDIADAVLDGVLAGHTTDGTLGKVVADIESHTRPMAKQLGLVAGVTAIHTDEGITVSDGDGSTTTTDNGGGSYTVESA